MKTVRLLFKLLLAAALLLWIVGLFLSPEFALVKSTEIYSPHPRVIQHIIKLSTWPDWWPWDQRGGQFEFSGPAVEVGATFSWTHKPARGRLVISKSTIYSVEYDIFLDGKSGPLKGSFEFKPAGNTTLMTWRVAGQFETPILAPYLALIADGMHGGMLSWGLQKFKEQVEKDKSSLEVLHSDETGRTVSEPVN